MSGRHTGEQHSHTVEGTDPQLYVGVHDPQKDAGLRPILLIHGFSASSKLNWEDTGWIPALLEAGRRVIAVDLPGHGRSGAPEDMDSYSPSGSGRTCCRSRSTRAPGLCATVTPPAGWT
jgi:pimeloyl-ACP methyl ester carboxylesterase